MTQEQTLNIEKNTSLFNAYDAILNASKINEIPFIDFLDMMKTLFEIKNKP